MGLKKNGYAYINFEAQAPKDSSSACLKDMNYWFLDYSF